MKTQIKTIQTFDTNHRDVGKQRVVIEYYAEAPYAVGYDGKVYIFTGKKGKNIRTGKAMREMKFHHVRDRSRRARLEEEMDERLWISMDETLIELD